MQVSPASILGAEYAVLPSGQAFTPSVPGIFIPSSALPEATGGELDPDTGNMAEIMRSLLQQAATYLTGLAAGDRPGRWRVTRANPATTTIAGQTGTFLRQDYTSSHDVRVNSVDAASEA